MKRMNRIRALLIACLLLNTKDRFIKLERIS